MKIQHLLARPLAQIQLNDPTANKQLHIRINPERGLLSPNILASAVDRGTI